jgi:hypothetical protein
VHRGLAKAKKEHFSSALQPPNRTNSEQLIPFQLPANLPAARELQMFNSEIPRPNPNSEIPSTSEEFLVEAAQLTGCGKSRVR